MGLVEHAERELRNAGLMDPDSDYDGMVGEAVLELVRVFAAQGHSGSSAAMTRELFAEVAAHRPLGPLTSNPDEWTHVEEDIAGDATTWQSRRNPAAISADGGRTYRLVDAPQGWFRRRVPRRPRTYRTAVAR